MRDFNNHSESDNGISDLQTKYKENKTVQTVNKQEYAMIKIAWVCVYIWVFVINNITMVLFSIKFDYTSISISLRVLYIACRETAHLRALLIGCGLWLI